MEEVIRLNASFVAEPFRLLAYHPVLVGLVVALVVKYLLVAGAPLVLHSLLFGLRGQYKLFLFSKLLFQIDDLALQRLDFSRCQVCLLCELADLLAECNFFGLQLLETILIDTFGRLWYLGYFRAEDCD